jgi:predicted DCC family thiol-disulfide oxidoreductase YuxK
MENKITVFYDGKCGLCRREIEHYKRIAPVDVFDWVDITVDSSSLERLGVAYADGLKLLHAQDSQGKLYVGVDAFILIWKQISRWRVLAYIVGAGFIRPTAGIAYSAFAAWRFNRLAHCQIATKADDLAKK